jgi:curved DNA-binding protein CbpA
MGSIDAAGRAAIRAWIDQQHQEMERSSYYHLLGLERNAGDAEIREAYYRQVARFHPDLYGDALAEDTRQKLVSLYSRLVEAYRCLGVGARREKYDRLLAAGKLRFTQEDDRPRRDPETDLTSPEAKRFFRMARTALLSGDARGAITHLKLALSVEPGSEALRAELARAEAAVKGPG